MVNETLDTTDSFVMPNPKGHKDSIKDSRFKAVWQSGPTRTIRVPIALAEATLDYARQLDRGAEPRDTNNNFRYEVEVKTSKSPDTSGSTDKVNILNDEVESLRQELEALRAENRRWEKAFKGFEEEKYELEWEVGVVRSLLGSATCSPTPPMAEFKLLEPAEVLNLLKGKRKKTQTDLRDIEVVWQILEELTPDKGN
ncbi:hypothetical protein [Microcoleus sp. herbarium14]|uniref:hypothetical protein n=1 Tax=Microcoleus sp. herbarium14 TaxID=3055439 RepID=UPI002FD5206F